MQKNDGRQKKSKQTISLVIESFKPVEIRISYIFIVYI